MKNFLRRPLSAALVLAFGSAAFAQTPYLETASLSFQAALTITGVSGTLLGPVPLVPGDKGVLDPDAIRPKDRITTDIGTPIVYSEEGAQPFFTKHFIRLVSEHYAEQYQTIARQLSTAIGSVEEKISATQGLISDLNVAIQDDLATFAENAAKIDALQTLIDASQDSAEIATLTAQRNGIQAIQPTLQATITSQQQLLAAYQARLTEYKAIVADQNAQFTPKLLSLEAKISYLKREKNGAWELTAVRSAQSTVAGLASTPYRVFLTRIERPRGVTSATFDTGFRLTPIASAGNATETLSGGRMTKTTGSMTAHFVFDFGSFYANDPLGAIKAEERAKAVENKDYNTTGELWEIGGTGYISYSLRSTPGPLAAVVPVNVKISGHGSWSKTVISTEGSSSLGGISPFAIKVGDIKYQTRALFPDYVDAD